QRADACAQPGVGTVRRPRDLPFAGRGAGSSRTVGAGLRPSKRIRLPAMRVTVRGMSEYQVRTRLYEPPEMVRRIEAKLACWKISTSPRMRGEDLRRAFEERLDSRTPEVVAAPAQDAEGPRIRLIA